jgi:hypothetical protein
LCRARASDRNRQLTARSDGEGSIIPRFVDLRQRKNLPLSDISDHAFVNDSAPLAPAFACFDQNLSATDPVAEQKLKLTVNDSCRNRVNSDRLATH